MKKEIPDINLSIKIADIETNEILVKESKERTILSYQTLINEEYFYLPYYNMVSMDTLPNSNEVTQCFTNFSILSALDISSIYTTTPDGTFPIVKINKNELNTKHSDILSNRLEQHLILHTKQHEDFIRDTIFKQLQDNRMTFTRNENVYNSPIIEVW